ncbi:MAG: MFS transporter, partial [Gammaproteobacteria bacterium]|nr:MFS transporter [Gammaproteobacteria bacterium]
IGFLKVIRFGMAAMLLLSIPVFYLLSTGTIGWISLGMVLMSIAIAITYAPMNAYMISLFPPHYRYSGLGVAFHLGISLLGGTAPLVMMWLLNKTGNLIAPAWYYVFGTIIGFLSLALCELSRSRIGAQQSAVF